MKILLIDNYDSFTFNLFQLLARITGEEPVVVANDQLTLEEVRALSADSIVISPGPGRPERERDFGVCPQVVLELDLPLLGVCLGHQGLAHCYGGRIVPAPEPMHGRRSEIFHDGSALFAGLPQGFSAVRYHSLAVDPHLPAWLAKTAWTRDGVVMGIRHCHRPLWGIQFHPESISTEHGERLLRNFCELAQRWHEKKAPCGPVADSIGAPRDGRERRRPPTRRVARREPSHATRQTPEALQVHHRRLDFYADPEAVFVELFSDSPFAFWLDSSLVVPGLSRFSFMGSAGTAVYYRVPGQELQLSRGGQVERRRQSIFSFLKEFSAANHRAAPQLQFPFTGGWVGYFGYELKAECQGRSAHASPLPDAALLMADRLLAFDHQERSLCLISPFPRAEAWFDDMEGRLQQLSPLPPLEPACPGTDLEFRLSRPRRTYLDDIRLCLEAIRAGESYELCLTNQLHAPPASRPLDLYRILRRLNPAPYAAFLRFGELAVLSSSPEQFLRIAPDGWVSSKPIKGTLGRSPDPQEDRRRRQSLAASEKDCAENLMIVDLLRNDLGKVCQVGTVHVPSLMAVETYATCHQLVSTIRGQLRPQLGAIDCLRAAFPGGSMTGAPKLRSMEILDRLEGEARGIYSGALGFLGLDGSADLSIVIRTAIATPRRVSIGAGGAIVALSDPQAEFEELLLKAQPLIRAAAIAARGEWDPGSCRIH